MDGASGIKEFPTTAVVGDAKSELNLISHGNFPILLRERYTRSSMRKVPPVDELQKLFESALGFHSETMHSQRYSRPGYFLQQWCMVQEAR